VLDGALDFQGQRLGPRSWIRTPAGVVTTLASAEGCVLWIKRGHIRLARL